MKNSQFFTPIMDHKEAYIWGVTSVDLYNNEALIKNLDKFAKELHLTVIDKKSYNFSPQGLTVLFLLAESHLGVHTWPEHNFLHIDALTCGKPLSKEELNIVIEKIFKPKKTLIKSI